MKPHAQESLSGTFLRPRIQSWSIWSWRSCTRLSVFSSLCMRLLRCNLCQHLHSWLWFSWATFRGVGEGQPSQSQLCCSWDNIQRSRQQLISWRTRQYTFYKSLYDTCCTLWARSSHFYKGCNQVTLYEMKSVHPRRLSEFSQYWAWVFLVERLYFHLQVGRT